MTRVPLFEILNTSRKVEKEEQLRKFWLVIDALKVKPEYVLSGDQHFVDLVAGSLELGLDPHIIYQNFYCPGTDTERAHYVDSALVIEDRKLCPLHSLEEVRLQTANEALGELRSRLD